MNVSTTIINEGLSEVNALCPHCGRPYTIFYFEVSAERYRIDSVRGEIVFSRYDDYSFLTCNICGAEFKVELRE